jgi:hypothetical protein
MEKIRVNSVRSEEVPMVIREGEIENFIGEESNNK